MSEEILKALMQMFAIISRVDGTSNGRPFVESFLRIQLNQEFVDQYLDFFDNFLETHHRVKYKKDGTAKRTSLNSVKVLKICTQINNELNQEQKVVVLLRLIEFINSNTEINEQELDFANMVSESFNIDDKEFSQCLNFIKAKEDNIPQSSNILVINDKISSEIKKTKHIYAEGIVGQVNVLWISSVNKFALIYYGQNELYLNGQNIINGKTYILTSGSSLRNSKVKPIYYSDIQSIFMHDVTTTKVSFVVQNLEYKFGDGKIGLHDINFKEDSGKLIGIMGSSGAGKSTLLNVLNGNEFPSAGSVKINGINIHIEKNKIKEVIGMVSQDDKLIEELTVFQNLFYNAKFCFGNKTDKEIIKIVLEVLTNLSLLKISNLKVGTALEKIISGGQRKRLNIALELIREPSVLFIDEPTSGLSSRDSENIMDLLKDLSLKGKLVFVVIHQPSSYIFKMFDKLIMLDDGGYPIFYGNPLDSVIHFKTIVNQINKSEIECIECGNVSPEQMFTIIESKVLDEFGRTTQARKILPYEWNRYYKERIEKKITDNKLTEIPRSIHKIPNKFKQFQIYTKRDILTKLTNKQYLLINLLEAPVLAFILAYLVKYSYNNNFLNPGKYIFRENENLPIYIFMAIIVALFIGLIVSAEEIIRDKKIQKRESFLHLSRASYIWSKITIMFLLSAIQTLFFVLVGNYLLEIKGMTAEYWWVLFSISCFANMLGLNISAGLNSIITIYILIPFLIIPQLLLSGAIVKFDKLNPKLTSQKVVPLAGDVMASRWAYEALTIKQFKENEFNKHLYKYDKAISIVSFKKNYWLPEVSKKINYCINNYKNIAYRSEVIYNLQLVKNEIDKELKMNSHNYNKYQDLNKLNIKFFDTIVGQHINTLLTSLKTDFINDYNFYNDLKDKVVSDLTKDKVTNEKFLSSKDIYENESLKDLVTNKNSFCKILDFDGTFIQKTDPVYLDPTDSNLGRSHFFAPQKLFLNKYYDTYWFNIFIIWLMSFIMFVTLYFNVLKRLIDSIERVYLKMKLKFKL